MYHVQEGKSILIAWHWIMREICIHGVQDIKENWVTIKNGTILIQLISVYLKK